ncbi:DoxX family protein [Aeromicrobium sp. Sec7.5]|uniref:DoxX family protein n=1 Tax=Aeromicrobium sp. Sec7.5 TaxID=3121276 RepID=UPI002FE4598B
MSLALIVLTVVVGAVLAAAGTAKVAAVPDMRARAAHLGFSVASYRLIGGLEVAGVGGLAAGLAWAPIGIAAALGLLAMMVGAVVCHVRAGDRLVEAVPAIVVGAAVVAVVVLQVRTA